MEFVKKCKEMIRPLDVVLVVVILLASFVPVGVFRWQQANLPEAPVGSTIYAIVTINGVEIERFALYEGAEALVTYTSDDGLLGNQFNIVEVDGERVRVQRDNSPDQIGVNMGWASRPGEIIIVLPHRFLIHIVEEHPEEQPAEPDVIIPF